MSRTLYLKMQFDLLQSSLFYCYVFILVFNFFEIGRLDLYRGEICEPRSGSGGVIRFLEHYVIVLMCDKVKNSCFLIIACQSLTIKIRKVLWGSGLTNACGWSLSRPFYIMFPYFDLSLNFDLEWPEISWIWFWKV